MKWSMNRLVAEGLGKIGIGGLAAMLLFGAASPASAMVWSGEGRPLIQTYDVAGTGEYDELDGTVSEAQFRHPSAVLARDDGSVLVADSGNHRIRIIQGGKVSVYAGIGVSVVFDDGGLPVGALMDGPAAESLFWNPAGLAADQHGNVYVADAANHAVRKIAPSGEVTTLAGNGVLGYADGAGSKAQFHWPTDVAVDAAGNVYVADTLNHAIRKITPQGEVTTLNALPSRIAEVEGGIFVPAGGFADGPLFQALFNEPSGLALDSKGNLYVSDTGNQRIRYVDFAKGTVTTVAGGGEYAEYALYVEGAYVDGPAAEARFNSPKGIAVDQDGGVYIADSLNHSIRYLQDGRVTTIIGSPAREYGSQGGFDGQARVDYPADVAIGPSGDLYIADLYNNKIRRVEFYALPEGWMADGTIRVLLDNQQITFDRPLVILAGRTMVPLAAFADFAGYKVSISGEEVVLTGAGAGGEIALSPGKAEVTQRSADQTMVQQIDAAPYVQEDAIYVPIRHLAELAGFDVDWHPETMTVILRR